MQKEDFAFLDFEASSLSGGSWPIEVGISTLHEDVNDVCVKTWSSLIYPHSSWDREEWSWQSANVHGLTFQDLERAPDAEHVAHEVLKRLTGKIVVSDAPDFDGRWLRKLLMSTGYSPDLNLNDFDQAAFSVFEGASLDMLYETLEKTRVPHRAGPDSARLAKAWAVGIKVTPDSIPRP